MRMLFGLAVIIALFVGCNSLVKSPGVSVDNNNIFQPGETRNLATSFATALGCDPATLTWSIQEASNVGFSSPLDGVITQGGLFTAPQCGSVYIGTVMHVVASGCGKTGVAQIAIAQELLDYMSMAYAVKWPGTPQACLVADPTNINLNIGESYQPYARSHYTCQDIYNPPLPAVWPPACL